jgi:hypothetical protein
MTYNQVVKEIQTKLEAHPLIKTVKFNPPTNWLKWDEQPVFPVACFVINSGGLNAGREQVFNIQMWFLDKSGLEGEFETEITSDQHSIAADVISNLRKQSNSYLIDTTINWDAISEKYEDYLSGVGLTLNLNAISKFDACDISL